MKNKKQPIVSVIVPTYNSAATLQACLKSIREQVYSLIELIVVDNHSTDATREIARHYADQVYIRGPERSAQRNYGVEKARGAYVAIIDSDMELSPKVIDACISVVTRKGVAGVIIPEESFGEGFWAQCKKLERSFYIGLDWMEAARFFDRNLYLELGGYDEMLVSGEDWDLSRRAALATKIARITQLIYHNEGKLRLVRLLRKKYYYAQKISQYQKKSSESTVIDRQMSPLRRYALFFGDPQLLWEQPVVGIGMLFMKTCEFGAGALGYATALFRRR